MVEYNNSKPNNFHINKRIIETNAENSNYYFDFSGWR